MSENHCSGTSPQKAMSRIRKVYFLRLIGRCAILAGCFLLYFLRPEEFDIILDLNFFKRFSIFHLLWGLWILDMVYQLFPIKKEISLGSLKLFQQHFKPIRDKINHHALQTYIITTTKSAYKVLLLWIILGILLALLQFLGILSTTHIFLISVIFYVCDLICVLIWCPFRLLLKNRCCTTCRIFNWDHLMMFTPLFFVPGFYTWSLFFFSLLVWLVWEFCIMLYPERFWEHSNAALQCSNCTDKLCTQYCQKLRQ